ncbi:MAG: SusC/RagA family TonB-linked outer membrane protein, partial [Bacteroidaceae bacterium]|nr:SusC/RagA family TonB-linked outer membrane protein [Bacteroidaceae bacterium]
MKWLAVLAFALSCICASAQSQVKGHVYDSAGEPLIGAYVTIEGTTTGSITDIDGAYVITAKPTDVLKAEYMGFTPATEIVGQRAVIDLTLTEDQNVLEDVVVIAYGAAKKSDLTGSVANVKMGDIKDAPVLSIDNALQGRIAGADFMSTDGAPGSTTTIRIRGTRSISASNEPLFIVDGIMDAIHDLNDINSDDIASISVLKDASSTAIYGSRGANGVIIITTKKGSKSDGKVNISFKADFGLSQLPRSLDIMNAAEFVQYRNDFAYFGDDKSHANVNANTPLSGSVYADPLSYGAGTDWIRNITRNAFTQNYALSLTGGGEKGSFYSSLAYNDTDGIIDGSGQRRFSGRIKGDRQIFPWLKASYNGSYTWRHTDENKATIGGTSWWNGAQYLSPLLKVTDSENPLYNLGQKINTPRAMIDLNTNQTKRNSMNHAISVDITPVEDLVISSVFSYYLYFRQNYRYFPGSLPAKTENEGGQAYRADYSENSMSDETTIRYKLEKNGHTFQPLLGFSLYRFSAENFSLQGQGYMDDEVMWNNMNAVLDKETYSAGTSFSSKTKMSGFARVDYNWKSRYYITATGRYDGASNFAANNKWAFFPSAALRWNISNENFMSGASWIDDLSLRFSAGLTGNDAISAYYSLAKLDSTTGGYLFDGSQPVSFYRSRLAEPGLTWEKTASYNLALDWTMFGGRVSLTAEAYMS